MTLRACSCGELHQAGQRCPTYRKPSGRNGSTRKWRDLRHRILKRDGHHCKLCGLGGYLEVHHTDGNHSNNHPDNLIAVCPSCHYTAHRRGGVPDARTRGHPAPPPGEENGERKDGGVVIL